MAKKPNTPKGAKETEPNWAQVISAIAAVTSCIIAVLAAALVIYQIGVLSTNAAKATAHSVYMSYHESTLRYPQFAEPNFKAIKSKLEEFTRYKTYVAHMLYAFDEMLAVQDIPEWRATQAWDFYDHKEYLCEERRKEFDAMYYAKMRGILKEFRQANCK